VYNPNEMIRKQFFALAFTAHALLGNLCMMPMAFAQEMPMPHEEHMEMAMTPMEPMSPAHCEHCLHVISSNDDQPQHSSTGCAGHCFSQANAVRTSAASFSTPSVVAVMPLPTSISFIPEATSVVAPPATAPPIALHIDTTVLRL
jgi:hypothetical protein